MKHPIHSIKMQRSRRCKINAIEQQRWAAYATAALASSVSFSLADSAEAEIHYSGLINREVGFYLSFTFPLGNDGVIQVQHSEYFYGTSIRYDGNAYFRVYAPGASLRGVVTPNGEVSVSRLLPHDVISAGPFGEGGGFLAEGCYFRAGCHRRGQFLTRGPGFVGFKFNTGAGDQYGWARVRMKGEFRNRFLFVDYAYGDPGEPITAGQRSSDEKTSEKESTDEAAPDEGSLGGLALGAAGLLAWRRRRSQ